MVSGNFMGLFPKSEIAKVPKRENKNCKGTWDCCPNLKELEQILSLSLLFSVNKKKKTFKRNQRDYELQISALIRRTLKKANRETTKQITCNWPCAKLKQLTRKQERMQWLSEWTNFASKTTTTRGSQGEAVKKQMLWHESDLMNRSDLERDSTLPQSKCLNQDIV